MNYNIPVRLVKLHKHQTDVIKELRGRGIKCYPTEFSKYVNGVENPPKSESVLSEADKIITAWEAQDVAS